MRKLIVSEFMSLDGIVEDPKWTFPYWNDETAEFKAEESLTSDALLLGRVQYEQFAAVWPDRTDDPGADFFNSVRKYVVSKTLKSADWNNSVILSGNLADEVSKLKKEDGKDIYVHGSISLAQSLSKLGLVDQYRFLMYPILLGKGKKMFGEGFEAKLKLVSSKATSMGVLALVYEPEGK
jgi:dihydrofolate reductase